MGDFPLMTETGTFIINGAERVIVSQLVRSPSVYYNEKFDKNGKRGIAATVIPNRGAWLEFETDARDVAYVRIDRTRKMPITVLLSAVQMNTDQEILDLFGENEYMRNTLEKDNIETTEKALLEIYERLRPGEPPTVENAKSLLESRFFDPKRYDLAHVGRYKMNKKLHIKNRLLNQTLAETIVDKSTGEVLAEEGDRIDRKLLNQLIPYLEDEDNKLNLEIVQLYNGVMDEEVPVQVIKILDATDPEGERVLHVVGNADVSNDVKHITRSEEHTSELQSRFDLVCTTTLFPYTTLFRSLLNQLIPYLEDEDNKLNLEIVQLYNGVMDEEVPVQVIKILDATDPEGERVLHVVGNADVSNDVKHIT